MRHVFKARSGTDRRTPEVGDLVRSDRSAQYISIISGVQKSVGDRYQLSILRYGTTNRGFFRLFNEKKIRQRKIIYQTINSMWHIVDEFVVIEAEKSFLELYDNSEVIRSILFNRGIYVIRNSH